MDPSNQSEAGILLDQLLESLLADFDHWFQRGDELLRCCPDDVMGKTERDLLAARFNRGQEGDHGHTVLSQRLISTDGGVNGCDEPLAWPCDGGLGIGSQAG